MGEKELKLLSLIFLIAILFFSVVGLIVLAGYDVTIGLYEALISFFSLPSVIPSAEFYFNPLVALAIILGGISSISFFGFIIGTVIDVFQEMEVKSKSYSNHIILCGYGTTGRYVAALLKKIGAKYVVIEKNPRLVKEFKEKEDFVEGDSSKREVLEAAGIKKAKFIIICLDNDASSMFTITLAKTLNPNIFIATKIKDEKYKVVFTQLGADFVTKPENNAGVELAKKVISEV